MTKTHKLLLFSGVACITVVAPIAIAYWMLNDWTQVVERTILNATSPSQRMEAILVQRDGHATVGTSYSIRIRKIGSQQAKQVLLIDKVDRPEDIRLSWNGSNLNVKLPHEYQAFDKLTSTTVENKGITITHLVN